MMQNKILDAMKAGLVSLIDPRISSQPRTIPKRSLRTHKRHPKYLKTKSDYAAILAAQVKRDRRDAKRAEIFHGVKP